MRARQLLEGYDHARTVANFGYEILMQVQRRNDVAGRKYMFGISEKRNRENYMPEWSPEKYPSALEAWKAFCIEEYIEAFEETDPTPKKAYVRYLIAWYLDGSIRYLEDLSKATPGLALYAKFRNRPDVPNIASLSTFDEFLDLAEELEGAKSQTEEGRAETEAFFTSGQAKLIFDDEEVKVVSPLTWEAAKFFGRGTRWCTSMESTRNHFDQYTKDSPLYMFLFKGVNQRWQAHTDSMQFMDARDHPLEQDQVEWIADLLGPLIATEESTIVRYMSNPPLEDVLLCVKEHPTFFKLFVQKDESYRTELPRDLQLLAITRSNSNYVYSRYQDDDEFKWAVINGREFGRLNAVRKPTEEMVNKAVTMNGMELVFVPNPTDQQLIEGIVDAPVVIPKLLNKHNWDFRQRLVGLAKPIILRNHGALTQYPEPTCFDEELQLYVLEHHGLRGAEAVVIKGEGNHGPKRFNLTMAVRDGTMNMFPPRVIRMYNGLRLSGPNRIDKAA